MDSEPQTRIAAEDYLDALAAHGIDHLFCNPGTDFAPIVEAFARAARTNRKVPRPMVVPHENCALAMAHGYTMITGKPQAVMLHTNVGTANAINALIDASRDRVPVLLTSGRTPFTERGPSGARSVYIHWAQEMYDQAGMLREMVKWDYEMKRGDQVADVVDRALELATASPQGPVYLSLPREVLGETVGEPSDAKRPPRALPRKPQPAAADIDRLADWIAAARMPLVITGTLGRDPQENVLLSRIADRFAMPVIPYNTRYFALSGSHSMFQGSMPGPLLGEADLVIVFETDVPWLPSKEAPASDAKIVQIGEDPLYARYPMRSFPSDLTLVANARAVLEALEPASAEWLARRRAQGRPQRCNQYCLVEPLSSRSRRPRHDRDQRVLIPTGILPAGDAGEPVRRIGRGRTWLGLPRGTRRQTRITGQECGRGSRRWSLHVCQPDRVPPRVADAGPADPDGALQQRAVWRGAAGNARHVREWRCGGGRRASAGRPAPTRF
jgi:thiamine pyrophosphate-dependent acetolactate synthase large subunit-like protein